VFGPQELPVYEHPSVLAMLHLDALLLACMGMIITGCRGHGDAPGQRVCRTPATAWGGRGYYFHEVMWPGSWFLTRNQLWIPASSATLMKAGVGTRSLILQPVGEPRNLRRRGGG